MAYIGTSPANGVRRKHTYTATAGQTSFSGADDNNVTLTYVDTEYLDVYQNGVKLVAVSDYASTTGTSVVLVQGASVDDTVEIIVFDVFSVADTVSAGSGGSFGGNIGIGGTLAVTGTSTLTGVLTANGGSVFNEGSADVDFRVESDNLTHALFVQGSDGNVGIGTSSPSTFGKLSLTVDGATTPTTADNVKNSSVNLFALTNGDTVNNTVGIFGWQSNAPGIGSGIGFSRENASNWGSQIRFYTHPTTTSNISDITERMRIDSSGNLYLGTTSASGGNDRFYIYDFEAYFGRDTGTVVNMNRGDTGVILDFRRANSSVGTISTNANSLPSDRNFKKDITDLTLGLDFVNDLKPSKYKYKADLDDSPLMYGLIAQDLESSLEKAGVEKNSAWVLQHNPKEDEKESDYSLDYLKLTPILIKAIQELKAENTALANRITALENGE